MPVGLLAFIVALATSLILTIPVRQLALRVGMVDHPGPRKVHVSPMPLLGGLAIYCGFIVALFVALDGPARAQSFAILVGATLLAIVGFFDDRGLLHHQIKLFVGMPVAALILVLSGIRAHVFSTISPGAAGQWADVALTFFWVVGITASFSILDHMDGLCAGVAAVASLFFAFVASQNHQLLVGTLAAAALGAALGFLRWNFTPAKIFMGDGGAMFLGFLMATLGLKLRSPGPPAAHGWLIPVLILGVPIFDTTLVSISRARRGLLPFAAPGKDHAAHRFSNLGLGQRNAVLMMYGMGMVFGLLALWVNRLAPWQGYAVAAATVVAVLVAIVFLERAPYERQVEKELAD